METGSPNFLTQLGSLWTRLNPSERLIVIASALILGVALAIWITVAKQPKDALLYGNLEPTDAGQVISELQSRNIPYNVADGGRSILVPADEVDELRISLASDGFMPTGPVGYELLDRSPLGMSDFLQRQNTTRAVEGEIARTLMSLDEVSAARVHLTLPEPTPFIEEQGQPTASVVLQISPPGTMLSRDKVAAVRTFVAGTIGGLSPENVTIIDQNMNLLTGPSMAEPGGLLPVQEEARRNFELQRAADIRSLLERAYGVGKVAVSFSCEMNFDEVETESLNYDPVSGTDHGVLVSEERTEDSTSGDGYVAPVGVPGTESNIPSYPGATGQPYESDSSTETKNYEISSTHEMRTQAPGTITRSSVGVLIDIGDRSIDDIGAAETTEVQDLVAAASGLDLQGTDVVTVAFRQFDTSLQQELDSERAKIDQKAMWSAIGRFGLAFFVLLVFWLVLRNFLKPVERVFESQAPEEPEKEQPRIQLPPADPAVLEKLRKREEIERLIREDPAAASKVIKTWLKE